MQVRQTVAADIVDYTDTGGVRALYQLTDCDTSIRVVGQAGTAIG